MRSSCVSHCQQLLVTGQCQSRGPQLRLAAEAFEASDPRRMAAKSPVVPGFAIGSAIGSGSTRILRVEGPIIQWSTGQLCEHHIPKDRMFHVGIPMSGMTHYHIIFQRVFCFSSSISKQFGHQSPIKPTTGDLQSFSWPIFIITIPWLDATATAQVPYWSVG